MSVRTGNYKMLFVATNNFNIRSLILPNQHVHRSVEIYISPIQSFLPAAKIFSWRSTLLYCTTAIPENEVHIFGNSSLSPRTSLVYSLGQLHFLGAPFDHLQFTNDWFNQNLLPFIKVNMEDAHKPIILKY